MKKRVVHTFEGQPPLAEVVAELSAKTKQLNELDDRISMTIARIERRFRELGVQRVLTAKLPDGCDLAWSQRRRWENWRFIIRDEDDVWELRSCTRQERCEVFTCGAMEKIVRQVVDQP